MTTLIVVERPDHSKRLYCSGYPELLLGMCRWSHELCVCGTRSARRLWGLSEKRSSETPCMHLAHWT
jgi:hypothetical protein